MQRRRTSCFPSRSVTRKLVTVVERGGGEREPDANTMTTASVMVSVAAAQTPASRCGGTEAARRSRTDRGTRARSQRGAARWSWVEQATTVRSSSIWRRYPGWVPWAQLWFFFFILINRGGHASTSENGILIEALPQMCMEKPLPETHFNRLRKMFFSVNFHHFLENKHDKFVTRTRRCVLADRLPKHCSCVLLTSYI